jgi:hypothetical protein
MRITRTELTFFPSLEVSPPHNIKVCHGESTLLPPGLEVEVLEERNERLLIQHADQAGLVGYIWASARDLVPEGEKYAPPKKRRLPKLSVSVE